MANERLRCCREVGVAEREKDGGRRTDSKLEII
jgi:hypothetical protein